jgi:1-acyl-sn-glycerol-3-phosphate acyltransferase
MKPQVYTETRPAEYFERFHSWARRHDPGRFYDLLRVSVNVYLRLVFRAVCLDKDKVPATGPAILAPNHFSFVDHFLVGAFIERKVRFMAKSQLFRRPFLDLIISRAGGFPVRRGQHDLDTFVTAESILARGGVIVVYPEGGRSRTGQLADRAKAGIGRLALESGAPVVPVALYGTLRARNWKRMEFPQVFVQYGDSLVFESRPDSSVADQQQVADTVFASIKNLYASLSERVDAGTQPSE